MKTDRNVTPAEEVKVTGVSGAPKYNQHPSQGMMSGAAEGC